MLKFYLYLSMSFIFIGCATKQPNPNIREVNVTPVNKDYIELIDALMPQNSYLMDNKNYIKSRNDAETPITNLDNPSTILSSILNFNRLSHNDRYAILQSDKIFLNTIDLNYLELPTTNSTVKLAVLDLKGRGKDGKIITSSVEKNITKDGTLLIKFTDSSKDKDEQPLSEPLPEDELNNYISSPIKKETISRATDSTSFHDRAMASIFADNESKIYGFSKISNFNNFEIDYIKNDQYAYNEANKSKQKQERMKAYNNTIEKVKEMMDKNSSIISTSLGLFQEENWVEEFRDVYTEWVDKDSNRDSKFHRCINSKDDNCDDEKFMWVISLLNKKDSSETSNSTNSFEIFGHTSFITAVSSVVDTNLSQKNKNKSFMKFEKRGSIFSDVDSKNINYFSINLPEKVLVAYAPKKLKFIEASTSYATAVFSAVLYNLYSLNPNLTAENATNILKNTAYNKECENSNTITTPYVINMDNNTSQYSLKCSDNKPDKIGYIVNIKGAYKEAVRKLIDKHLKAYFSGDIKNSLYRDNSLIEKTSLIKDGYIVKKIKIKDKNKNNMKKGTAFIVDNTLKVEFSANNIICRYEQDFYGNNYYDRTKKEITIEYDLNGSPYIVEERNLLTKSYH